ncbi:MATE family efflux transporter [Gammaproteobacteria bacterium]|nr:MATE family efflux transporter [Gammaproteobacteria bacterium]
MRVLGTKITEELVQLLTLGIPLVVAQLLQVSYGFVAIVMMGRVGTLELAAIGLGTSLWVMVFLATLGVLMVVSPVVARQFGAGQSEKIRETFQQALWLSLIVALGSWWMMRQIGAVMSLMSVDASVIPLVEDYLQITSWGMPSVCLYFVCRFVCEGTGNARPMMLIQLVVLPIYILLSWALIFGKLGFPALAVNGAALAGTICLWVTAGLMLIYVVKAGRYHHLKLFSDFARPRFSEIGKLAQLGIPVAGLLILESSFFNAIALMMGSLGQIVLAAHNVVMNYVTLIFMIPVGLANALMVRVGQAMGESGVAKARFRGLVGISVASGAMVVSALVILVFPQAIIGLYTADSAVAATAAVLLVCAALFQLSDGIQITSAGALRGLQDTTVPMFISGGAYWLVGVPTSWWLGIYLERGPLGLWLGLILGLTVGATLLGARFLLRTGHLIRRQGLES